MRCSLVVGLLIVVLAAPRSLPAGDEGRAVAVGDRVRIDGPTGWVEGVVVGTDGATIVVTTRKGMERFPADWRVVRMQAPVGPRVSFDSNAVAGGVAGALVGLPVGALAAGLSRTNCGAQCPGSAAVVARTAVTTAVIGVLIGTLIDHAGSSGAGRLFGAVTRKSPNATAGEADDVGAAAPRLEDAATPEVHPVDHHHPAGEFDGVAAGDVAGRIVGYLLNGPERVVPATMPLDTSNGALQHVAHFAGPQMSKPLP